MTKVILRMLGIGMGVGVLMELSYALLSYESGHEPIGGFTYGFILALFNELNIRITALEQK